MVVTHPIHVEPSSPFSLQNIPFGIFSTSEDPNRRVATIVGDLILDLSVFEDHGVFDELLPTINKSNRRSCPGTTECHLFSQPTLNAFAAQTKAYRQSLRRKLQQILTQPDSLLFTNDFINNEAFFNVNEVTLHLPFHIGGFTDFLTSNVHAENCAELAGQRCHPSFYAFPTAYNGRASSVVVGGEPLRRPKGMMKAADGKGFVFAQTAQLDFELELGVFVSTPIPKGSTVTAETALDHIFGLVLLNDWSARDIQFAEMIPLGPFNGKATATSVSPWVVVPEALEPSLTMTTVERAQNEMPNLATHLRQDLKDSTWDIDLEVLVDRRGGSNAPATLCRSNFKHCYWSFPQMLAHHSSSACGLQTGDLIGSGTISAAGHKPDSPTLGCLHELTKAGTVPIRIPNNESMVWLENGDEVIFNGWARGGSDTERVGFGELRGKVVEDS